MRRDCLGAPSICTSEAKGISRRVRRERFDSSFRIGVFPQLRSGAYHSWPYVYLVIYFPNNLAPGPRRLHPSLMSCWCCNPPSLWCERSVYISMHVFFQFLFISCINWWNGLKKWGQAKEKHTGFVWMRCSIPVSWLHLRWTLDDAMCWSPPCKQSWDSMGWEEVINLWLSSLYQLHKRWKGISWAQTGNGLVWWPPSYSVTHAEGWHSGQQHLGVTPGLGCGQSHVDVFPFPPMRKIRHWVEKYGAQ